ncbi:RH-like protein [Eudromia elegans]
MPSKYRNFRNSVPWLILSWEAVFIILFYLFFSGAGEIRSNFYDTAFQDVSHMVVFGLGFFLSFLKRYGFSSIGFSLLIVVLGVQWSVLIEGFVFLYGGAKKDDLGSIIKAVVSVTAVVISFAAILGKANPVQLVVMTIVEIAAFHLSRWINKMYLEFSLEDFQYEWYMTLGWTAQLELHLIYSVADSANMMHVHLFGAYFGVAVSSSFPVPQPGLEKAVSTPTSSLLSVLGTLFLWTFWPSFNSAFAMDKKNDVIYSTYFALAVSAVTAFALSALTTKDGKLSMAHIHRAALAGGVTVGYAAESIKYPWIAMILGLLASVIAILGSHFLQRSLPRAIKIHDVSGVHFTFGLPAVLGALAQIILYIIERWNDLPSNGYFIMIHIGAFCLTINVALVAGFITGLILNLNLLKTVHESKYCDDQLYWEFPHLAVGF